MKKIKFSLKNLEVITSEGEPLGWVINCSVNSQLELVSLTLCPANFLPFSPLLWGTFELAAREIIEVIHASQLLLVAQGAEKRLKQLTVGIFQRWGLIEPLTNRNFDDDDDNDVGSSVPVQPKNPLNPSLEEAEIFEER